MLPRNELHIFTYGNTINFPSEIWLINVIESLPSAKEYIAHLLQNGSPYSTFSLLFVNINNLPSLNQKELILFSTVKFRMNCSAQFSFLEQGIHFTTFTLYMYNYEDHPSTDEKTYFFSLQA